MLNPTPNTSTSRPPRPIATQLTPTSVASYLGQSALALTQIVDELGRPLAAVFVPDGELL